MYGTPMKGIKYVEKGEQTCRSSDAVSLDPQIFQMVFDGLYHLTHKYTKWCLFVFFHIFDAKYFKKGKKFFFLFSPIRAVTFIGIPYRGILSPGTCDSNHMPLCQKQFIRKKSCVSSLACLLISNQISPRTISCHIAFKGILNKIQLLAKCPNLEIGNTSINLPSRF